MLRHPTSIALTAIANWVTADGCVHIAESVGSRRELVAKKSRTHRRRRRDATGQFRRVGVGVVYWALGIAKSATFPKPVFFLYVKPQATR